MKIETFETYLKASGAGAFKRVEIDGDSVILRSLTLKVPARGTGSKLYFDGDRNEVMTGRRFDPLGSLWLLRGGGACRVYSNLTLAKELPEGVKSWIELTEDAKDAFGLMNWTIAVDEAIQFTVFAFRPIEIEPMCSIARLRFEGDFEPRKTASGRPKKKGIVTTDSTRTKNHVESKQGADDAGVVPKDPAKNEKA